MLIKNFVFIVLGLAAWFALGLLVTVYKDWTSRWRYLFGGFCATFGFVMLYAGILL